jgi:hypothetical protein
MPTDITQVRDHLAPEKKLVGSFKRFFSQHFKNNLMKKKNGGDAAMAQNQSAEPVKTKRLMGVVNCKIVQAIVAQENPAVFEKHSKLIAVPRAVFEKHSKLIAVPAKRKNPID